MQDIYIIADSLGDLAPYMPLFDHYHEATMCKHFLMVAAPKFRSVRLQLEQDPKLTVLPSLSNPRPLTAAEAAKCCPDWGVTVADTVFSAMQKAAAVHGDIFLPDL